jgi:hypothetical protein
VDQAAGLPEGSTSNVFRSRAALLEGTLAHHASLDLAAAGPVPEEAAPLPSVSREDAAALVAAGAAGVLDRRSHNVARFELLLEGTRREELQEPIAQARAQFAKRTRALLRATGCESPERHARQLLAMLDGFLLAGFYGPEAAVDADDLTDAVERFFKSC